MARYNEMLVTTDKTKRAESQRISLSLVGTLYLSDGFGREYSVSYDDRNGGLLLRKVEGGVELSIRPNASNSISIL